MREEKERTKIRRRMGKTRVKRGEKSYPGWGSSTPNFQNYVAAVRLTLSCSQIPQGLSLSIVLVADITTACLQFPIKSK